MIIMQLTFYSIVMTATFIWFWIRSKRAYIELYNKYVCLETGHLHFINPRTLDGIVVYELVELPDAKCHWEANK